MSWLALHMISLYSLLILDHQTSCRCISEARLEVLQEKYQNRYWKSLGVSSSPDYRTCEQAARDMRGAESNRSVSPWRYRIDRDDDRFPRDIAVAECICEGCIINQEQNNSYNSRLVYSSLMVQRRTGRRCEHDSSKHEVKKDFIRVAVGCTCVVPNSTK